MSDLVWIKKRADAVAEAKKQGKKVLLVGWKEGCSVCAGMKEVIEKDDRIHSIVEDCFVIWHGELIALTHTSEWSHYVMGMSSYKLPFIAVIDPSDPDKVIDRSYGRQEADVLYNRLAQYSCTEESPALPDLDFDELYQDYVAGVKSITLDGKDWCGGKLISTISFIDAKTGTVVSGLENFSMIDIIEKLYNKFPTIKKAFDEAYYKDCKG